MKVYLDYAATSPIKKEVYRAITPYLQNNFGNPSSIHEWGRVAKEAIENSRKSVADFLGAQPKEIVFTSCGTEADNLAVRGVIMKFWENRNRLEENGNQSGNQKGETGKTDIQSPISNFHQPISLPHIITSEIEHHAILNTCKMLEKEKLAEVTYIKPNEKGIVEIEKIKNAIKKNTVLVSIMYVNNEVGTVQPIREIGKMIEKENRNRLEENGNQYRNQKGEIGKTNIQSPISKPISNFHQPFSCIYFHTDAVQATEYQKINVDYLHVDMLTISGHKIGAPKGIGALYIRKGTLIKKCLIGGEQEMNMRAGTENVAGIVAIGKAVELVKSSSNSSSKKIEKLRDYFIDKVLKEIPAVKLNGDNIFRSPNNANFYFQGIEGESILLNLDLVGIAASSGSACTSVSLEPSHVLMALFNNPERAHGSIRFTLGFYTTKEEIDYTVEKLVKIVEKLRVMSPLWQESDAISSASRVIK